MKRISQARSDWFDSYNKVQCEYCKEEFVGSYNEFKIGEETVEWKCPNCGCINHTDKRTFFSNHCDAKGEDTFKFELTEEETKAAREFMLEHNKCNKKDIPFTALGMQYTYEITPGGLGDATTIKCNACGAKKELTDTENW